jgi:hypothetical protein
LFAWNALLANRKLNMSRGEFIAGAPHGIGKLVYVDFKEWVVAEERREAAALNRSPQRSDTKGGGFKEIYDKANEQEYQAGPNHSAS